MRARSEGQGQGAREWQGEMQLWPRRALAGNSSSSGAGARTGAGSEETGPVPGSGGPCLVVLYDKVRGYLNWHQEWFKAAAKSQCRHTVTLSEKKADVGGGSGGSLS
jgi:hypothetical protein